MIETSDSFNTLQTTPDPLTIDLMSQIGLCCSIEQKEALIAIGRFLSKHVTREDTANVPVGDAPSGPPLNTVGRKGLCRDPYWKPRHGASKPLNGDVER